jgi:very-short-patch-repair endonuclease
MERKMHAGAIKYLYQRARELRNNSTHAEEILWDYLKCKPFGYKFRRQHPYSIYILDFYCHSLKLVIEVDGSIHTIEDVKQNDRERQSLLEKDGLTVIRFLNDQIEKEFKETRKVIEMFIANRKYEQ